MAKTAQIRHLIYKYYGLYAEYVSSYSCTSSQSPNVMNNCSKTVHNIVMITKFVSGKFLNSQMFNKIIDSEILHANCIFVQMNCDGRTGNHI